MKRLIRCVPLAWQSRKASISSPVCVCSPSQRRRRRGRLEKDAPRPPPWAQHLCPVPAVSPSTSALYVTLGRCLSSPLLLGIAQLLRQPAPSAVLWTAQTSRKFCLTAFASACRFFTSSWPPTGPSDIYFLNPERAPRSFTGGAQVSHPLFPGSSPSPHQVDSPPTLAASKDDSTISKSIFCR